MEAAAPRGVFETVFRRQLAGRDQQTPGGSRELILPVCFMYCPGKCFYYPGPYWFMGGKI